MRLTTGMFMVCLATASGGCFIQGTADVAPRQGHHQRSQRIEAPFDAVVADGSFSVRIVDAKTAALTLEGTPKALDRVTTTVRNGTLHLDLEGKPPRWSTIQVVIASPQVSRFQCDGACTVNIDEVSGQAFALDLRGSSRATLAGEVDQLDIEIAGSGRVDTTSLRAQRVAVDISGSGRVDVNAVATLDAEISGAGHIGYLGEPQVSKQISGAGFIAPI